MSFTEQGSDLAGGESRRWWLGWGRDRWRWTQRAELDQLVGVSLTVATRKRAGGGERRRRASEMEGKGAPVGDLDGDLVGELRESSRRVVLAWIRPEEGYGGLSMCAAMAAVRA